MDSSLVTVATQDFQNLEESPVIYMTNGQYFMFNDDGTEIVQYSMPQMLKMLQQPNVIPNAIFVNELGPFVTMILVPDGVNELPKRWEKYWKNSTAKIVELHTVLGKKSTKKFTTREFGWSKNGKGIGWWGTKKKKSSSSRSRTTSRNPFENDDDINDILERNASRYKKKRKSSKKKKRKSSKKKKRKSSKNKRKSSKKKRKSSKKKRTSSKKKRRSSKRKKSRARVRHAKKHLGGWLKAVGKARKQLGITGFVPIKKGSKLYNLAKKFYDK